MHRRQVPGAPTLPDSFRKIAGKSPKHLETVYRFPSPIVQFYKSREELFLRLRSIRDNVFHHGHSPGVLFEFDDGFATAIDDHFAKQLDAFNLWPEDRLKPNRLGSVLPIFSFLVKDMFDAMNHLGDTLLECVPDLPAALADGYQVFLRSSVSRHLLSLDRYQSEQWFDPKEILRSVSNPK